MSSTPVSATDHLGELQRFVIPRDHDRDVAFNGWLLECAEETRGTESTGERKSGLKVCIYFTKGESIVIQVARWATGKDGTRYERSNVTVHPPENWGGVIESLKKDNAGRLGNLSKEAWVRACEKHPKLKSYAYEEIE